MRQIEQLNEVFMPATGGTLLIAYNGVFSQEVIVDLGQVICNELGSSASSAVVGKVFRAFIELSQNILYHSLERDAAQKGKGRLLLIQNDLGFYLITSNLIEPDQMGFLKQRIKDVNRLEASELKSIYLVRRRQLARKGNGGAGLGIMDLARRSSEPLGFAFAPEGEGRLRFYLRAFFSF